MPQDYALLLGLVYQVALEALATREALATLEALPTPLLFLQVKPKLQPKQQPKLRPQHHVKMQTREDRDGARASAGPVLTAATRGSPGPTARRPATHAEENVWGKIASARQQFILEFDEMKFKILF